MRKQKVIKRLLPAVLILLLAVMSMNAGMSKSVQAASAQGKAVTNYFNTSVKYLYLGEKGDSTFDFNIKKELLDKGAAYSWYVAGNKGNPKSVTVDNKTGVVTAKEAGTAYIRCKITKSDKTVLRPEAKVIVRNNITEVAISNIPDRQMVTVGVTFDFNRQILNTADGKNEKTQGITRWEVADDTAGVGKVTNSGKVIPAKEGGFRIRAICFESTAKYKQWLFDKEANAACITAASEWTEIMVVSSGDAVTVSTQEQLGKVLKKAGITRITLSTDRELKFTIPEGDYSGKTLIVNAPHSDVRNYGVFKEVTIEAIKDSTWIEFADGNIFYLEDNVVSFVIDKEVNVKRITVDTPQCTANIEILGVVEEIIILQPAELNITGSSTLVPISVEGTANGSTITTSVPLDLKLKAKTDITLQQGAEETVIDKSDSKVVVKVENNTNKDNTITTNKADGEGVGVGKTVISDGHDKTNPPSIPDTSITTVAISGITVTGDGKLGATLTAATTPAAATGNFQWSSSDTVNGTYTEIPGATSNTYVIDAAYAGKFIKASVTGIGNYSGTQMSAAIGVSPAAQLTISAPTLALTKEYDGSTTAVVTAGTLIGVKAGDEVTVSAAANYASAAAGTGKTITVVYTLGGADAAKYLKPVNYTVTTAAITKAALTIAAPTLGLTKTYDGTTTAAVTKGTLSGVIGTDKVTISAIATYDIAAVGTGKTITVVYTLGGAAAANYEKPENYTIAAGAITPVQLTIALPNLTASKAYNGSTTTAVTAGALHGIVGSDNVTVSAVATYETAAVGTGKSIMVTYSLGGAAAGNYEKPADYTIATGAITRAQLTITEPVLTTAKVYDGTAAAAVTPGTLNGVIGTENVTVSAEAAYASAAVGTGKTITVTYTLGGADAANYTKPLNDTVFTGEITAEPLTVTDPVITLSKVYDGTTTAAVTAGALIGVNAGDDVTVSATAAYTSAAVDTGKTITVVYTLGGTDAAKYVKPVNYTVTTATITKAALSVAVPTLDLTKAYDNTTTAAVTAGDLSGVIGTDNVTVSATASYTSATVGTGKTITVVYTLGGPAAGNYEKPTDYTVSTGVINAAQLTINSPTLATERAYNGTTTAAVTAGTLIGVKAGDDVTVNATAAYTTASVGTGKTITVTYTLGGAAAGNYVKPVNYKVTAGVITRAKLSISGTDLTTAKAYDGTVTAAVIPGALSGVAGTENVTVSAAAAYNTAVVGTGKTIRVAYTLSGADAGNYIKPVDDVVATGAITAIQLTFQGFTLHPSKAYDGNTAATVTGGNLQGVVGAEDVTVSKTAVYNSAAAGTGKLITISYTLSGVDAGNYVKPVDYTTNFGNINKAPLTINSPKLTINKTYDGNTSASVTAGTLSGVLTGDVVTVNATAAYTSVAAGTGKTITVVYTLGGAAAGNYTKPADYTVTNAVITPVQLTIAVPNLTASRQYDGGTAAQVTAGALSGVISGDTVTVKAAAAYDTSAMGTGKTITVTYTLEGTAADNYIKPEDYSVKTAEITRRQLSTSVITVADTKTYDGTTTAAVLNCTLQGVIGTDNVAVSATAAYNTKGVGSGKTITVVYTLSGAAAGNYIEPANSTLTTGIINPVQLTISAPNLTTEKVYDGGYAAAIIPGTLTGVKAGDNVTVSATAEYNSPDAGDNKSIYVIYTLGGDDRGNYLPPQTQYNIKGKITAAPLTLTGITANGTSLSETTTELTMTFSGNPTTLTVDNLTVEGATKGTLSGTGNTRTVTISHITGLNGSTISVTITNPNGYSITPSSGTVAVNVRTETAGDDNALFTYIYNDTGITLINYTGTVEEICIDSLGGHKVTEIATQAIKDNAYLKKISIITLTINQNAIYGCTNLETIVLGNVSARSSSVGPTRSLQTIVGDTLAFVLPGTYKLIGNIYTYASDASIKTTSKIKGVSVNMSGLGNLMNSFADALLPENRGTVSITSVQAKDLSNTGNYITLFDPTTSGATVKAVKVSSGGINTVTEIQFNNTAMYSNEIIASGDIFLIKVVAIDGTTIGWYSICVNVTN